MKQYSKDWCKGFCTKCGTSCSDYNEEIYKLNKRITDLEYKIEILEYENLELKIKCSSK